MVRIYFSYTSVWINKRRVDCHLLIDILNLYGSLAIGRTCYRAYLASYNLRSRVVFCLVTYSPI